MYKGSCYGSLPQGPGRLLGLINVQQSWISWVEFLTRLYVNLSFSGDARRLLMWDINWRNVQVLGGSSKVERREALQPMGPEEQGIQAHSESSESAAVYLRYLDAWFQQLVFTYLGSDLALIWSFLAIFLFLYFEMGTFLLSHCLEAFPIMQMCTVNRLPWVPEKTLEFWLVLER